MTRVFFFFSTLAVVDKWFSEGVSDTSSGVCVGCILYIVQQRSQGSK